MKISSLRNASMKQQNMTMKQTEEQESQRNARKQTKEKTNSYFAGNLNQDLFSNKVQQKKKEAQEKALKIIGDTWENDRSIDMDILERREKVADLQKENEESQKQIDEIQQMQKELQEQYGIENDSQEQKDLQLLRKKKEWMKGKGTSLTKEELEYTEKLEREGLTDYQTRQLEYDNQKSFFQENIDKNKKEIVMEYAIIRGIRLERLKQDPMVKAQEQAEEILEAASKEIISMVVEDAKEHIDEKQEKEEEKAEELKEKKKEQEAFVETQKEKKTEQENLLDEIPMEELLKMPQMKEEVKKEIQNIVSKMKLVAEDIKGAMVDKSV